MHETEIVLAVGFHSEKNSPLTPAPCATHTKLPELTAVLIVSSSGMVITRLTEETPAAPVISMDGVLNVPLAVTPIVSGWNETSGPALAATARTNTVNPATSASLIAFIEVEFLPIT